MLQSLKNLPLCSKSLRAGYCSLVPPNMKKHQTSFFPKTRGGGKYKWWQSPIDVSPIVPILEQGPDFTFQDGRVPIATSKFQVERMMKQVELRKRVIKYLAEIDEMKKLAENDKTPELEKIEVVKKWTLTNKIPKELF